MLSSSESKENLWIYQPEIMNPRKTVREIIAFTLPDKTPWMHNELLGKISEKVGKIMHGELMEK